MEVIGIGLSCTQDVVLNDALHKAGFTRTVLRDSLRSLPRYHTSPAYLFAVHYASGPIMTTPAVEEGKMLSEALNTVKIQVQQMKRFLVCCSTARDEIYP